jgi:adenylate cyclase
VRPDRAAVAHLRHELRTPLNHVIGYSEMLLEDAGDGGAPDYVAGLQRLHEHARRLLAIVNEALAPARLETHGLDLDRLPLDCAEPVRAILATAEAVKRGLGPEAGGDVVADIDRIMGAAAHFEVVVREGVALPADAPVAPAPAPVPAAAAEPGGPPTPVVSGTILVVDDNESNREMLARRLARQGYQVSVAADGLAALAHLAAHETDLVLLDVMMPGLDGYEVLTRLKADARLRAVPVLMISALDEMDSVVRCIELGAEDYLSKPFDPVLLRARIGACLEKVRLRALEVKHLNELAEWNRTLERRVEEAVGQMEKLGRLKRFFSPALAELIVAGGADDPLRSHRREVTVVFLDLRGFTAFSEQAEPEEVMGVLRDYHAAMGGLVMEHEGTLERFTGDGMMIFFNDPVTVPNPGERAVRMAVAMRDRVEALSVGWRRRNYNLACGIGIAQGYATIGAIGFEGRWDYGAIGPVTNLAARLCAEAKGGQILVGPRVLGAMEERVEVEELEPFTLKGFSRPVPVYNVLRLKE